MHAYICMHIITFLMTGEDSAAVWTVCLRDYSSPSSY